MNATAERSPGLPRVDIRNAVGEDEPYLEALYELSDELVRPQRGGHLELLTHPRRSQPADFHLVATIDDLVVGTIEVSLVSYGSGEVVAVVDHLFMHPEARGIGAGRALLQAGVVFARQAQAIGIDARALPGDRATKNFFESFGLVARSLSVYARLDN